MYPLISKLLEQTGFTLQSWNDNYGAGVWVCCLPLQGQCNTVNDWSYTGEREASNFLLSQDAQWLPISLKPTFTEALIDLESRLVLLPDYQFQECSEWCTAVETALDHFQEQYKLDHPNLQTLPADFSLVTRAYQHQLRHGGDVVW